jgi:hypothetical protein
MSELLEREEEEEEEVFISFSIEDKTWWGEISLLMLRIKFPFQPALMHFLLCIKKTI